jgi:hypothetical protein
VLEHLPSIYDVGGLLSALSKIAADYIVIWGPNFDTEEFLYSRSLKVLHSAMLDHLCKFRPIDLVRVLFDLDLRDFVIGLNGEMRDSNSPWIHRADSPGEGLFMWNEENCLPKPFVHFSVPLYRDIISIVKLNSGVSTSAVLRDFPWGCDKIIIRSAVNFSE